LGYDLEWAKIFLPELLRGTGSSKELSLHKHSITYLKVMFREPVFVRGTLVLFLRRLDGYLKLLMKLVEIRDKLMSTS
jgi:hypothetical protein